jgi:hypothetical protein
MGPGKETKELYMKASRLSSIFAAALLFALPAFAGNTVKKSLEIRETVTIEGTQLHPGNYRFEWSGTGPDVQVTISHNGDKVATVPGHLVQESASNDQTGYGLKAGPNGEKDLSEVFFSGEKYNLELQPGSAGNNSNSGTSPSK